MQDGRNFPNVTTRSTLQTEQPRHLAAWDILHPEIPVLLACVSLFDALRSSGLKWGAAALLAPLAFLSLIHLAQAASHLLRLNCLTQTDAVALAAAPRHG